MPVYEYKCKECDNQFEKLLSRSNRDNGVHCPECSSSDIQRLMSACNIGSTNTSSAAASSSTCSTCSADTCSTCNL